MNWQNKLTEQNLNLPYLVLYSASAKDANATVLKREDLELEFIMDKVTYWYSTNNLEEAYYLSAVLNSETPNLMMKDFQSKGLFGARDVSKKILDIYYPRYDAVVESHKQLAELGWLCHEKTAQYLRNTPPPAPLSGMHLGKLRLAIKRHLAKELKEVDQLVKKLIAG